MNSAAAQLTTIDFELGASCGLWSSGWLTTEYQASHGVVFSGDPVAGSFGGKVLNECANVGVSAQSGTDFLVFNHTPTPGGATFDTPQLIQFATPVQLVGLSVSGAGDDALFAMMGYDSAGSVVATSTVSTAPFEWANLSVVDPSGSITQVRVITNDDLCVMDDLEFGSGLTTLYCRPDPLGVPCPCGNNPTGPGESCVNSTGAGATLTDVGSVSLAAADLTVSVSNLPMGQFGLVYSGQSQVQLPFGDGLRCVAGGVVRSGVMSSGPTGSFTVPDVGNLLGGVVGGTRHFQGWYRDPAGPCGSGFNLTAALTATFAP